MNEFIRLVGFDQRIFASLGVEQRSYYVWVSTVCLAVAFVASIGVGYGAWLATSSLVLTSMFALSTFFIVTNLYRLLHSGSGFPLHYPIARLERWRPGLASTVVLFVLGCMLLQPVVLLVMQLFVSSKSGIIAMGHAAWKLPAPATVLTVILALSMSATAWLRFFFLSSVRAYEQERWIEHRMLVDDAHAQAQEVIDRSLQGLPGYQGLRTHFSDAPYNTRPLLFGFDPELIERDGLRFIKPATKIADHREGSAGEDAPTSPPPEPAADVEHQEPKSAPPLPPEPEPEPEPEPDPTALVVDDSGLGVQKQDLGVEEQSLDRAPDPPPDPAGNEPPPEPLQEERAEDEIEEADDLFDDEDEAEEAPVVLHYLDIGRMLPPRARRHADEVAPFIAALTHRDEKIIRGMIRVAPDDLPMHRLFSEWKSLKSILLHPAGFALDHDMAGIISIAVGRPPDDVLRRLRAAPRDKRLAGVFAPELARKLLGRNIKR